MVTSQSVRDAFKYLYPAELPALKELVQWLPPNPLVINIGAGAGTSGLAILESRPDVVLVTIDVQDESSPLGCLVAERDVVQAAGYGSTWQKRWFQVHGDSKQVGKNWRGMKFGPSDDEGTAFFFLEYPDMVFVDGDHSYAGCMGDITVWWSLLKPYGLFAVHDYHKERLAIDPNGPHPMPWPGVSLAVDEVLMDIYPCVMCVDSLVCFRKEPL